LDLVARRGRQASSFALMEGAENLLVKAMWRWREDQSRALGYVDVALKLPFDEHERTVPAASTAIFLLFSMVTDELEESAEGDTLWLDAALNVLDQAEPTARFHLRDVLVAIDQDYSVGTLEHRRLRAAVKSIPPRRPLRELTDLGVEQLRAEVVSVVGACVAYQEELERLFEESTA
jgi:hypothetical protein